MYDSKGPAGLGSHYMLRLMLSVSREMLSGSRIAFEDPKT